MKYDKDKQLKLEQIIYMAKISTLFFCAVAFFQHYFKDKVLYASLSTDSFLLLIVILTLLLVYFFWTFLGSKTQTKFSLAWIQPVMFMTITCVSILLTGAHLSNYKFLFLFIIISNTIERGMKAGFVITVLSSIFLLGIDLFYSSPTPANQHLESDLVLSCAFMIITWTIGYYSQTEREHIKILQNMANVDGLTGLYNHRYFHESLGENITLSKKTNKSVSLLLLDIDYFKHYNDLHGHQKGDEVLKQIANILKENIREKDIVSRYGGEEFAIIMPDTQEAEALEYAEKIRIAIENNKFYGQEYLPNENLTISIGVSVFPDRAKTELDLVKYADEALYRAKFFRKNRVEGYASILDGLNIEFNETNSEILTSVKTLIAVINANDKYTYMHVERVVIYCKLIANRLNLTNKEKKDLIYAAYMHDIGKIDIPKEILMKQTKLTDSEWEELKKHPQNSANIISGVTSLKDVIPIILQHHERYDGTGYPSKLKGDKISYLARILTVADSFDAMTSDRPYHKKKSIAEAIEELRRCSGTQFDPNIVEEFIAVIWENTDKIMADNKN